MDVCCPGRRHDGQPLGQTAGVHKRVEKVVSPAVPLDKAAETLIPEAHKQTIREINRPTGRRAHTSIRKQGDSGKISNLGLAGLSQKGLVGDAADAAGCVR